MKLQFFCPRWGSEQLPFSTFVSLVKKAGYDGVEMGLPFDERLKQEMLHALQEAGLLLIAQHWETVDPNPEQHAVEYERRLRNLASAHPLFINSQTGKDHFSFDTNRRLIELASAVSQQTGVQIVHETHRGKFSFAAHITKEFLLKLTSLQLTLDVSHWCNVAETFLDDQPEALQLALERTFHIHARVGYPQGPQVPDPQDPLWADALQYHLRWWLEAALAKQRNGATQLTITPEFGAPPYMVLLPYTHQPVSSQWDNNLFMMHYLRQNLAL